ncbi:hypothetical protein AB0M02_13490 [Actinoplanes sp. NPDC051861]|uniref:hypothetical protein n=1 Tax=Actinoplanes sp. NPDC051861 TaxID=3155170 RepID=UPI003438BCEA
MRRTALYLGGLLLATGASLAMAGPATAAPSGGCCGYDDEVVYVQSDNDCCYDNGGIYDYDDCNDDVVYVNSNRRNRIYGGGTRVINTGQYSVGNSGYLSGNNVNVDLLGHVLGGGYGDYTPPVYEEVEAVETDY